MLTSIHFQILAYCIHSRVGAEVASIFSLEPHSYMQSLRYTKNFLRLRLQAKKQNTTRLQLTAGAQY
jgi:hypothetical protein